MSVGEEQSDRQLVLRHWPDRGDAAADYRRLEPVKHRCDESPIQSAAMQSQPLVDESPQHNHHHHHLHHHHHKLGPAFHHHHSGLQPSLNRFRLAVRNVAKTLHLNHHHRPAASAGAEPSSVVSSSRKFHGPSSLLGRFRSAKIKMSDDSEQSAPLTARALASASAAAPPLHPDNNDPRLDSWNHPQVSCPHESLR